MSRATAVVAGAEDVAAETPATNGAHPEYVFLTRDQILTVEDLQTEIVPVPEWGEKAAVFVRTMNGTDRDAYERGMYDIVGNEGRLNWSNFRAKLIARCVVDDKGNRLFREEDIVALGKKSSAALMRLFEVCQRLNGLGENEQEAALAALKDVPNDGSGSG